MLLISLIIIYAALAIVLLVNLFMKHKGVFYYVIAVLSLVLTIVAMGFSANYAGTFGGYSIVVILSVLPQLFLLYEPMHPRFKSSIIEDENVTELVIESNFIKEPLEEQTEEEDEETNEETEKSKKKKLVYATTMTDAYDQTVSAKGKRSAKIVFCESKGDFFSSLGFMLTALLIAFAGLYIGKESIYPFIAAVPLFLFGCCLYSTRQKRKIVNMFDALTAGFYFAGVGVFLCNIISVLLYSITIHTILYAAASLVFLLFGIIRAFKTTHRLNILLYIGFVILAISIIL